MCVPMSTHCVSMEVRYCKAEWVGFERGKYYDSISVVIQ